MRWTTRQQILVGVLIVLVGSIVTVSTSWIKSTSDVQARQTSDIAVLNTRVDNTNESITEIKQGQVRIEAKLDRVLERRSDK